MSKYLILFLLAVIPVIIIGYFVYSKDKNKEPFSILVALFLGGVASCIITLILTFIFQKIFPYFKADESTYGIIGLIIKTFIEIGLIEEFSKWIMTYLISYHNKEYNEAYDMIVYAVFTSLGF